MTFSSECKPSFALQVSGCRNTRVTIQRQADGIICIGFVRPIGEAVAWECRPVDDTSELMLVGLTPDSLVEIMYRAAQLMAHAGINFEEFSKSVIDKLVAKEAKSS